MGDLSQRLRAAVQTLRRTPMPLADLIPLLQQAADALDAPAPQPDARCVTAPDGECVSTDPRCMHAAPPRAGHDDLRRFYNVTTDAELIAAQARHIEKLQAKLPAVRDEQPRRVREG